MLDIPNQNLAIAGRSVPKTLALLFPPIGIIDMVFDIYHTGRGALALVGLDWVFCSWSGLNMTASWSHCRYALVLVATILASASNAWAGDITYNIVDYPADELDPTSSTLTVAGTIITDGTIGPLSAANIIGGTFSLSSPHFDVAGPTCFTAPIGLEATPTELLLDVGIDSSFSISTVITGQDGIATTYNAAGVTYENTPGGGLYCGSGSLGFGSMVMVLPGFYLSPVPTTPGSIGANADWIIATVPEPSTFALLAACAMGLMAYRLRRRRNGRAEN